MLVVLAMRGSLITNGVCYHSLVVLAVGESQIVNDVHEQRISVKLAVIGE